MDWEILKEINDQPTLKPFLDGLLRLSGRNIVDKSVGQDLGKVYDVRSFEGTDFTTLGLVNEEIQSVRL